MITQHVAFYVAANGKIIYVCWWEKITINVGSMCGQRSCNRANHKQDDKLAETASADTATFHPGLNLVILAAPAAACIAIHPLVLAFSWLATKGLIAVHGRTVMVSRLVFYININISIYIYIYNLLPILFHKMPHHSFLHDLHNLALSAHMVWKNADNEDWKNPPQFFFFFSLL